MQYVHINRDSTIFLPIFVNIFISSKKLIIAEKTLQFIIDSNGGLTKKQIEALEELIDGGFIEAINNYELKIHN